MRRILRLCFLFQFLAFSVPAFAADGDVADPKQELADTQDKLSTALHSYALLDNANSRLKADLDKASAELAVLRPEAPLAAKAQALQERVRQLQDEVADLAAENARLRTRLSLLTPPPGGGAAPQRPGGGAAP